MNLIVEPGPAPALPVPTDAGMLMHIIERAAHAPEFDLERLEKLLALKERWDKNEAVKAFAAAKVAFKRDPPSLIKDKHVHFTNRAGTVTEYDHATHNEVTTKISESLARHGLTHAWSMAQEANGKITVACTLTHAGGHSERVELSSLSDDSGGKNSIQAIASANTYLQRYTLLAVTGLSTSDMPDDDGRAATLGAKPDVAVDVWTALRDGSKEGSGALAEVWRGLSDTTRAVIVLHYGDEWQELKSYAGSVPKWDGAATQ